MESTDDKKLFSQYYSRDLSRYEDKEKFRRRLLKYLEDFVNSEFPKQICNTCRSKMGIDIEKSLRLSGSGETYCEVEKTFTDKAIDDILDFVGVCFYTFAPYQNENKSLKNSLIKYVQQVNEIFHEESMCYTLHADGQVRYYPDDEFQKAIVCTLKQLEQQRHRKKLEIFNEILDDFYKNYDKESPLNRLFKFLETLVLSILADRKNRLSVQSADALQVTLLGRMSQDALVTDNDREGLSGFTDVLKGWIKMSHKYRHGKPAQEHNNVPVPLFNVIFSVGISILRFLLECDDKYGIIPILPDDVETPI